MTEFFVDSLGRNAFPTEERRKKVFLSVISFVNCIRERIERHTELVKGSVCVQGDHSGCDKPPVDIKTKVAFQEIGLILKQSFCFDVNRRFVTT